MRREDTEGQVLNLGDAEIGSISEIEKVDHRTDNKGRGGVQLQQQSDDSLEAKTVERRERPSNDGGDKRCIQPRKSSDGYAPSKQNGDDNPNRAVDEVFGRSHTIRLSRKHANIPTCGRKCTGSLFSVQQRIEDGHRHAQAVVAFVERVQFRE